MADNKSTGISYKTAFGRGQLHTIDNLPNGSDEIGPAIKSYSDEISANRKSLHWQRAVRWIENIFFSSGRQYVDDILISRLSNSSETGVGDLSVVESAAKRIPRPTNDLLGRYIETNIALLTENRPRPRITSKSDTDEDQTAAELSELTLEYLWEALVMPEKHRELVRIMLHTGMAFLEVAWDVTVPRRIIVPEEETEGSVKLSEGAMGPGGAPVSAKYLERKVPKLDEKGNQITYEDVEYGDMTATIVSPFAFHAPAVHFWNGPDMGWVMKEEYTPIDILKDRYGSVPKDKYGLTVRNGWNFKALEEVKDEQITQLSLWWWERISELVEGPGPSLYLGTPDQWTGHTIVRTFDRKPSPKWPKGRTVITVGDEVLYDSPKRVGARTYDKRWPDRWHPYIRFRWEPQIGSIHGRSLISKLLPKLKRVNAIDTTMIMWRRTVPISKWIAPKGTHPIEGQWTGEPGTVITYDPRRTAGMAPTPVNPPPYPSGILEERQQQLQEMESIAGTEQILRGERPTGVNSAAMIDILRKQALASRSAILQAWDESLQEEGSLILQTVIKHVKEDDRYAERIKILAREKHSTIAVLIFSGADLSDNVAVRVDTASMALVSQEARQARMVEILQYLPNIQAIEDQGLRQAMYDELGLKKALMPNGPDINRARKMISLIKNDRKDQIFMLQQDDPYIFSAILTNEIKTDGFIELPEEQQKTLLQMLDLYTRQIALLEEEKRRQEMAQMRVMASMGGGPPGGGGGGP